MHSHLIEWPISSKRTLYEQECCDGKGSKEFSLPFSDEMNLQYRNVSKAYLCLKYQKGYSCLSVTNSIQLLQNMQYQYYLKISQSIGSP